MYNVIGKLFTDVQGDVLVISIDSVKRVICCKGEVVGGIDDESDVAMWFDLYTDELLTLIERITCENEEEFLRVEDTVKKMKIDGYTVFASINSIEYVDVTIVKNNIYDSLTAG